jgi:hypothetical protein
VGALGALGIVTEEAPWPKPPRPIVDVDDDGASLMAAVLVVDQVPLE